MVSCALSACGGGSGDDDGVAPDAQTPPDAGPPDADFSCNVVFLNFEGAALTPGQDDATTDTSSIVAGPETYPPFRAGDPDRIPKIEAVATQITDTLAPVGMTIVTTRPADGDYTMVMIGGESGDIGLADGVAGIAPFAGCGTLIPRRITMAFEADNGNAFSLVHSANIAIGSILVTLAVPTSDDPGDCLCWDAPGCTGEVACTIGDENTPRFQQGQCGTGATFDEPAVIAAALACD
jgi:hypothetical protein